MEIKHTSCPVCMRNVERLRYCKVCDALQCMECVVECGLAHAKSPDPNTEEHYRELLRERISKNLKLKQMLTDYILEREKSGLWTDTPEKGIKNNEQT